MPNQKNPILPWLYVCLFIVLMVWGGTWYALHDDTDRGTFGDMFGAANALFSGLAFTGVVMALILQTRELQQSRIEFLQSAARQQEFFKEETRNNTLVATQALFQEWWSEQLHLQRKHFYTEFLPKHYSKLRLQSLKHNSDIPEGVKANLLELTGFFDRVGWLGAAGLIDVSYVLGPMQHTMRRVWFATEDMIRETRTGPPGQIDPAFRLGFEWLYRRSEDTIHHQVRLLNSRFSSPCIFSDGEVRALIEVVSIDEEEYLRQLRLLAAA